MGYFGRFVCGVASERGGRVQACDYLLLPGNGGPDARREGAVEHDSRCRCLRRQGQAGADHGQEVALPALNDGLATMTPVWLVQSKWTGQTKIFCDMDQVKNGNIESAFVLWRIMSISTS